MMSDVIENNDPQLLPMIFLFPDFCICSFEAVVVVACVASDMRMRFIFTRLSVVIEIDSETECRYIRMQGEDAGTRKMWIASEYQC
jgi:hypothetical protein